MKFGDRISYLVDLVTEKRFPFKWAATGLVHAKILGKYHQQQHYNAMLPKLRISIFADVDKLHRLLNQVYFMKPKIFRIDGRISSHNWEEEQIGPFWRVVHHERSHDKLIYHLIVVPETNNFEIMKCVGRIKNQFKNEV